MVTPTQRSGDIGGAIKNRLLIANSRGDAMTGPMLLACLQGSQETLNQSAGNKSQQKSRLQGLDSIQRYGSIDRD